MSSAFSTFAQKLNISSPKSRPRTSGKASLPDLTTPVGVEIHTPGIPVHAIDSPSKLGSDKILEDTLPSSPQQFVDRDGASPNIVYSSPDCFSTTELSIPSPSPLTNRPGFSLFGTSDGFLPSSPGASTQVGNSLSSPSPDFVPEEGTLAQRRDVKRLLSLRSSYNPNIADRSSPPRPKSPFASLSPLSPRIAFNLLRRFDLDSPDDKCLADCPDGVFDPFSRTSPSVFYSDSGSPSHEPIVSSWLSRPEGSSETDDPEIQAWSPLNDLSVYLCPPPQPHADTPSKGISRLHIWVSGIELQSPTTGINLAAQTPAQPQVPLRGPKRENRKPKLRPLVLPNLAALREIVNAQQEESIVLATCLPRTVVPQQDAPRCALHHTSSSESVSPDTVLGPIPKRPFASPLRPPELVTSTVAFPVALGSGHARRLSRESTSEPVIVGDDGDDVGDGNVGAAPQQTDAKTLSQPPCYCSVPVPHACVRPSQDQEEPPRLMHEGEALRRRGDCDKPLPEEPQGTDKPLPRAPLEKPLPQVPPEARLEGLISLLHQAGVLADSAQSLRALALACGSGHTARSSVSPNMLLKTSPSMDLRRVVLEAMNDRAGHDRFAARSSSLWSISTQWAYAV